MPFALPALRTAADAKLAASALLKAVADGELTPSEASEIGRLLDSYTRILEREEFEQRLIRLEEKATHEQDTRTTQTRHLIFNEDLMKRSIENRLQKLEQTDGKVVLIAFGPDETAEEASERYFQRTRSIGQPPEFCSLTQAFCRQEGACSGRRTLRGSRSTATGGPGPGQCPRLL